MLKDSIDFDYNLKQIKQEIDSDIQLQDEVMDSEKMNNTFSTIEILKIYFFCFVVSFTSYYNKRISLFGCTISSSLFKVF